MALALAHLRKTSGSSSAAPSGMASMDIRHSELTLCQFVDTNSYTLLRIRLSLCDAADVFHGDSFVEFNRVNPWNGSAELDGVGCEQLEQLGFDPFGHPSASVEIINTRLDIVQELVKNQAMCDRIRSILSNLHDLQQLISLYGQLQQQQKQQQQQQQQQRQSNFSGVGGTFFDAVRAAADDGQPQQQQQQQPPPSWLPVPPGLLPLCGTIGRLGIG
uniref:Uncharacterized protein n=1 Tax=Globodera rostochiensis TaxID=31243 RepID=A0A914IBW7_GLORO